MNWLIIYVAAVSRIEIGQLESSIAPNQAGMIARNAGVRNHDIVVFAAANRDFGFNQRVFGRDRFDTIERREAGFVRRSSSAERRGW